MVLFDDLLWKDADREAHVLVARHRGVEIEVFDIRAHETGVGSGNDAVEEDFGSSHVGGRCADIAGVVDEVAADGEADSVRFGLLRANGGNNSSVGDLAVRRYLFTLDEVNCVRNGGHTSADTLDQATNFVGKAMDPFVFGGALRELAVFEGLASDWIED